MCDRTCTKSCLIREDSSGNTFLHTHKERSHGSSCHRCRRKRSFENGSKYSRNVLEIQNNNSKCKNYIDQCHKRNKLLCDLTDSLNSAKKDQTDQNCKHNSDNQIQCSNGIFSYDSIVKKCRIDCCCDCINLCCISCSKYCQNSKCSEQISQPVPMLFQTIFDIIHRSTDTISFHIRLMEMNCKSNFWKLCTHSKKCWDPHPEHCARSSDCDSTGNPGDISGSDRRRQRGTNCLERSQCTVRCISFAEHPSDRHFHRIRKFSDLKEVGPDT